MENIKTGSVFLQTERDYVNYSKVLREIIYMSVNAEKIVQKCYPDFIINPVMIDTELAVTGIKKWEKRMIGFNYTELDGFAYYILFSIIYLIAKQYSLDWFFEGYICKWTDDDHHNSFTINIQKSLQDTEDKKNMSLTFWELKLFFERQFSDTVF